MTPWGKKQERFPRLELEQLQCDLHQKLTEIVIRVVLCSSYNQKHGLWTQDGEIPNSLRPKVKSQSQINIWDVDIKAQFFVEIMVD